MKATRIILCFVAMATMVFAGCKKENNGSNNGNGGSGSNALAGSTWQLLSQHDEDYSNYGDYDVLYTMAFGQNGEATFTRNLTSTDYSATIVMTGTYTYSNGKGEAWVHTSEDPTEFRYAFTISGNSMVLKFGFRDLTLTKL